MECLGTPDLDIQLEGVGVTYDTSVALHPLSLRLNERRIAVIGLNGSGKSTFARLINGLVKPSSGTVTVDSLDSVKDKAQILSRVGYVFQNPHNQIILPIIRDDIAFGLKRLKLAPSLEAQRIEDVLARLKISHLIDRRAHELSGGELQLAALAALLVMEPKLLIMDEPTNQLDMRNRWLIDQTMSSLDQQIIAISHDLPLIEGFDRALLFHEGRLHADCAPPEAIALYKRLALA